MKIQTQIVLSTFILLAGCAGSPPKVGVKNGQLTLCPSSPNCVSSQAKDKEHFIEPIVTKGTQLEVKTHLLKTLNEMDRTKIILAKDDYLNAEFTSKIFHFVDDVEFYFPDTKSKEISIYVRSASRLGYSDLGVNRERIEMIRSKLKATDMDKK
ncbi:MAG: DUF1499 domain-containing protein [Candidatus Saccharibacteria bacterium]|nr:DUF1499 domain-containing protein [Moraxellaceae bacterium]